ncbi:MAG: thiamine diphosphokinase [Clostridia bacterium]|nr:thiamine diphosphokinase [Clostridia bacterium]
MERALTSEDGARGVDALVFAAGDSACRDARRFGVRDRVTVICADAGVERCCAAGLAPDIVVGDFDSVCPAILEKARLGGARIVQHPVCKDETDLDLALAIAIEVGARSVIVSGVTGGRIDHTLANLEVCMRYARDGLRLCVVEEWGEAYFVAGRSRSVDICGRPGEIVTVMASAPEALGVRTAGLLYPLRAETLPWGASRGVSNLMTHVQATVEAREGNLLVIHLLHG